MMTSLYPETQAAQDGVLPGIAEGWVENYPLWKLVFPKV
jgi:hypothetical protein